MSPRERAPGRSIANAGQSYRRNRKGHMVGRPIVVIDWVRSPKLGELCFSESENALEPVKGGVKGERRGEKMELVGAVARKESK